MMFSIVYDWQNIFIHKSIETTKKTNLARALLQIEIIINLTFDKTKMPFFM